MSTQPSQTGDERLIDSWTSKPFTSVRKRSIRVEHRLLLVAYPSGDVDVCHQVKCPRRDVDDWTDAEVYEVRDHGIERVVKDGGRWT